MMEVRATGRKSFKQVTLGCLGTGTIVDFSKHVGTMDKEKAKEGRKMKLRLN